MKRSIVGINAVIVVCFAMILLYQENWILLFLLALQWRDYIFYGLTGRKNIRVSWEKYRFIWMICCRKKIFLIILFK